MASKLGNITFDCADPTLLATFWADVFGYPHPELPADLKAEWMAAGLTEDDLASRSVAEDPTGEGPRFFFQQVPEGKVVKNRVHIDILATPGRRASQEEVAVERDRIVGLGATVVENFDKQWGPIRDQHVIMQDPEGNEFCLQ